MTRTLTAIDLCCGAGGASVGLHRAGFDVTGVDIAPQPSYPFRFVQADAMRPPFDLSRFDLIWASPPCQRFSVTRHIHAASVADSYPDLIEPMRRQMAASGRAYIIENVPGAPLHRPHTLCGTMFGLGVMRHRLFETTFPMLTPPCGRHGGTNSSRGYSTGAEFVCVAGHNYRRTEGAVAMGIDWMRTREELSESIPPAYSEFIGGWARRSLEVRAA